MVACLVINTSSLLFRGRFLGVFKFFELAAPNNPVWKRKNHMKLNTSTNSYFVNLKLLKKQATKLSLQRCCTRQTLTHLFSCEFFEMLNKTIFIEHLQRLLLYLVNQLCNFYVEFPLQKSQCPLLLLFSMGPFKLHSKS